MEARLIEIKIYSLPELLEIDIDAWTEAMCNLADRYGDEVDGYDPDADCPAEYDAEFMAVAEKHGVLFRDDGTIYEAND